MMHLRKFFISRCPLDAVSLSGRMSDGFYAGQLIILVDRCTRYRRLKLVERVVDAGDGNCTLDLSW
jgi:hypothetical protein